MDRKQHILDEIRRTAAANGGMPLGHRKFFQETGIKDTDWRGKIWARWGDAVRDAGFEANRLNAAYSSEFLIERFVQLCRELGRIPVSSEIRMRCVRDANFPSHNTFERLGPKSELIARVLEYCRTRTGFEDVIGWCVVAASKPAPRSKAVAPSDSITKDGYVYLCRLKIGSAKRFKIGKAVLVERRKDQLSIQLPADLELIHQITTDDAYGIEAYWHRRFAAKHTKGEWFDLSRQDIEAFKRRKFM